MIQVDRLERGVLYFGEWGKKENPNRERVIVTKVGCY